MKDWRIWLILGSIVIAGTLGYFSWMSRESALPYEGTELSGEAPDFILTDQNGSMISLSNFRGKVIVLTFMDSKCKDTCPLTAAQLRLAYQQLDQTEASQVAFIGVNVNVEDNAIADVYEITQTWHLDEIPIWHFLTGSADELTPVWKAYGVAAVPQPAGEIIHTPGVFLVDKVRQERWYISMPYDQNGEPQSTAPLSNLLVKHIREILSEIKS